MLSLKCNKWIFHFIKRRELNLKLIEPKNVFGGKTGRWKIQAKKRDGGKMGYDRADGPLSGANGLYPYWNVSRSTGESIDRLRRIRLLYKRTPRPHNPAA